MVKYDYIYAYFKDKITDYDLLQYQMEIQDEILLSLLNQSCAKFQRICKNDLSLRDDELGEFSTELTLEEIDILTEWMVEAWLRPFLNDSESLRDSLNTKDFQFYSPANMLDKLQNTYTTARKTARSRMNEYSFIYGDWKSVKT